MNINISGSNLNGSPIIAENKNSTIYLREPTCDWEHLRQDLEDVIHKLPTDSRESVAAKEILHSVKEQDKPNLLSKIKRFAPQLASKLFISTASEFLSKFINSIL